MIKYEVEGDEQERLQGILQMRELQYLLQYPGSKSILSGTNIKFKARSIGEMKEEIREIFDSVEAIRHKISVL